MNGNVRGLLEPCAGKLACTVLRGRGGGDAALLPDRALGGSVMKGERGSMVVYADKFIPKDEQERAAKDGDEASFVPFLKRYTVFNAAQCEGLPENVAAKSEPHPECETIPRAEYLIAATGADFRIGGDKAFYVPSQDFIRVPPQPAFFEQINYYRTCFHELGHWVRLVAV